MKKLIMVVSMLASGFVGMAQENMTAVENVNALFSNVNAKVEKVTSIESDLTMTKHKNLLKRDMVSKGKFYYSKPDKVCMDFEKTRDSKYIINGEKMLMSVTGAKSVRNISSNPMMQEMYKVVSSSMTGNLQALQGDYEMEYLQNATHYMVKITPKNAVKKLIERIELMLLKSDYSVESMKIVEPLKNKKQDADFTQYSFENKKLNVNIPASMFDIKE
ncbi:MAG: outer membrane lipoprotein carrier protein LolA [Paludibacteraceae bacterium]|nr:outer membrane lipoprotein carrier protein LolA [Paludibacteraceae bacterium]